jgi:outer membrane lipoprotein-sorting protein
VSACRTGAPREDITEQSSEGSWTAKTLVQDKKKHKTNQLELDFIARRPLQLRMEAITPGLGIHVASFVLNGNQMSYILTRQKKFVTGAATEASIRDLIQVEISPDDLVALLFDRALNEDHWNCKRGADQLLEKCQNKSSDLSVVWSERTSSHRVIEINSVTARVTMSLSESQSKVQINDSIFILTPPDGFKTQQL